MIVSDRRLVVILDFNTRLLSGVRFVENGSSVSGFAYFNCLLSLARYKMRVGYTIIKEENQLIINECQPLEGSLKKYN